MDELKKPCPFCGRESNISTIEFTIKCQCGIHRRVRLDLCDTDSATVINAVTTILEQWNRRFSNAE